jgi:hypothetical protein
MRAYVVVRPDAGNEGLRPSAGVLCDELIVDVGVDGLWPESGEQALAVFLDPDVVLLVDAGRPGGVSG